MEPTVLTKILPKSKAQGIDFCATDECFYIIRSDLKCYLTSTDFGQGKDLEIFSLHDSCSGGDHYLATHDNHFYILKGDQYRHVRDMTKDLTPIVETLHPNCRGGDFYFSAWGDFYIIFLSRGVFHQVSNMSTDEGAIEYSLHPDCMSGLYYWATKNRFYFLKPQDKWGTQYYRCIDLHRNEDPHTFSFHADVVNIMPGGLAITQGPAFGKWDCIKTIANDSTSPIDWNKVIKKKVGFAKSRMMSVENSWKISMGASVEPGGLVALIAKVQFSMSAECGGSSVNTDQEEWSEATEVEESVKLTLQPGEKVYVWQYQLGLGTDPVLFCRDMKFTSDPSPPTEVPLPHSGQ